jgi:hypothetical protein
MQHVHALDGEAAPSVTNQKAGGRPRPLVPREDREVRADDAVKLLGRDERLVELRPPGANTRDRLLAT